MTRIVSPRNRILKFFQSRCIDHLLDLIGGEFVMDRDEQQINVGGLHIIVFLCPVDPLQIQKIDLRTSVAHEQFQISFL